MEGNAEFLVLGPIQARFGGDPVPLHRPRLRALLALLLLHGNEIVSVQRLAEELWHGSPPSGAEGTLHVYVSHLRKALDPGRPAGSLDSIVLTRRPGYVLQLDPDQLDAERFERLAIEGHKAAAAADDPTRAAAALRAALALWRGPALMDVANEPFAQSWITRLEELRLAALEDRIDADLALGRRGELAGELEQLVAEQPFRERLWGQLMVALYRDGRQADALRAYQRLREGLREELGVDPSPALQELQGAILHQELEWRPRTIDERPTVATVATGAGERSIPNNLPVALTSFVGREELLRRIRELLSQTRLLTLTGSGGCGKTRLALVLASQVLEEFPDGVWFAELATVTDPVLVPEAVAVALGLRERHHLLTELLTDRLNEQRALLILDNCEHVVGACAALAGRLLERCPNLRILTTSREELAVSGECLWRVPSLSLPRIGPDAATSVTEVARSEAASLFVDRARAALPEFALNNQTASAVAGVCEQLDGIPLAIELAAPLVRMLPVEEIAKRLGDRFSLLTYGSRHALPRHQTLRGAIDWSYDCLDEDERRLFTRLSVFVGEFSLKAAEAVGAGDGDLPVFEALAGLLRKSTVMGVAGPGGTGRYRMLETMRQYGRERLAAAREEASCRRRHAAFFAALAEEADRGFRGENPASWLTTVAPDLANFRAALEWSFRNDELGLGLRLASALRWLWTNMGLLSDVRGWLDQVLKRRAELQPVLRMQALGAVSSILFTEGDYVRTSALGEEALVLARDLGNREELAYALITRGASAVFENNMLRAAECFSESLMLCEELKDRWGLAWSLAFWGAAARRAEQYQLAEEQLNRSLALFDEMNDKRGKVLPLINLGMVARHCDDLAHAHALCAQGLAFARESGDPVLISAALSFLGIVELYQDVASAQALFHESLKISRGSQHKMLIAIALEGIATVAARQGRSESAVTLWSFAERFREAVASPLPDSERAEHDQEVERVRVRLDEASLARALARGAEMTLEEAFSYAQTA